MPTVNEIFRQYAREYANKFYLSDHEKKIIRAVSDCRTIKLGGRKEVCSNCGHTVILYNSCRNRHCPQCQFLKKEKWIIDKKNEVFPYQYFHAVFTLPDEMNKIVCHNRAVVYKLLFDTVKYVLLNVSGNKKYFGAKIGFFAILHTWGQKLNMHPHIHCVIPGGGYSDKKHKWISAKKDFLVPVKVLKQRFKYAFLTGLKKIYKNGRLKIHENKKQFQCLIDELFGKEWVVYLKETFNNPDSVIEYLSKYTHRIAISNHRIIKLEEGKVFFKYRDYSDGNKMKIHSLSVLSFIRHFMLHSVPYRFTRIRYYGILSNRNKSRSLKECRDYYNVKKVKASNVSDWRKVYLMITGVDLLNCMKCKKGKMLTEEIFKPSGGRSPPVLNALHNDYVI